jgi:hypothetical protein
VAYLSCCRKYEEIESAKVKVKRYSEITDGTYTKQQVALSSSELSISMLFLLDFGQWEPISCLYALQVVKMEANLLKSLYDGETHRENILTVCIFLMVSINFHVLHNSPWYITLLVVTISESSLHINSIAIIALAAPKNFWSNAR